MSSTSDLALNVAMGLSTLLFPGPVTLGDVRWLTHGRLHLAPEAWTLSEGFADFVARFLRHRTDELVEDQQLLGRMRQALASAHDFRAMDEDPDQRLGWSSPFTVVPGQPIAERVAGWLDALDRSGGASGPATAACKNGQDMLVHAGGISYRVPATHLPPSEASWKLETSPRQSEVRLDAASLRRLARQIDEALGGRLYEDVAVEQFLARFLDGNGSPVAAAPEGVTRIAVAPTGTGKSVFARLLALHLASNKQPVSLVVPDVRGVWTEVRRLRDVAAAVGLPLRIAPLHSWRGTPKHLAGYLENPPAEDPVGQWGLREAGYSCLLSAYAEGDPPAAGQEPCTKLRQRQAGGVREVKVACPFGRECGRFRPFAEATSADIIVVNHHSLLAGRVPLEVAVDGRPPTMVTTAEVVLRRSVAVLIDEIDAFQNTAIGADSRSFRLSSRGRLSKPIQLYTEVERRRAEERIGTSMSFERGRSALLRIMSEAERIAELINRDELVWPPRGQMVWREAHDPWIGVRLYGDTANNLDRVRTLFDKTRIEDDEPSESLRLAMAPLGPGLGDGTLMEDVRADIVSVLTKWKLEPANGVTAQKLRSQLADRLIVRAALLQLDNAIGHLRPQLPALEQLEIPQASEVRDDLLGYAPWQPSPAGALGRRLNGYVFERRPGEPGALESRIMAGDPHGLVRELGNTVARAIAGVPRVVIGFSATCRFRGSPQADVLGELLGYVPDNSRTVSVREATVKARVSGTSDHGERMDAVRDAATELWTSMLARYLDEKASLPETRGRARALIVTGSYLETEAVAQAIRQVAGPSVHLRFLTADSAAGTNPDALPRAQIESFGRSPLPAVLIGPLSVVARGHNILQEGTTLSALSGVFVLTRPVPPAHDVGRFLGHVAYNAQLFPTRWRGSPGETVVAERGEAWRRLRALQRSAGTLRRMDPELRRELVCDVLVELAQLAGRARRGGTPVDLVFVDAAFQDEVVPWSGLVKEVLVWWREEGWLDEMVSLHGAFVRALADYAGVTLPPNKEV